MRNSKVNNLIALQERIVKAKKDYNRKDEIKLIAVSKKFPAKDINDFFHLGLKDFGENYIQEWEEKLLELKLPLIWHIIGNIQSNKTKLVAEHANWVHTIDREKIAQRLSEQRPSNLPDLNICIEINITGEKQKHGIKEDELDELVEVIAKMPKIRLRGLMCVPSNKEEFLVEQQMARMQILYEKLKSQFNTVDTLSMGMTDDLELAIKHGSTALRIGTALFGSRKK